MPPRPGEPDRERADAGRADPGRADPGHSDPGHSDAGHDDPAQAHSRSAACEQNGPGPAALEQQLELDVDARFLLANERTLLAWLRTSLTLLAAGVAVQQFGAGLGREKWLAPGLFVLGALAAAGGAVRHARADRALRQGRLPPTGKAPLLLAVAVAALAAVLLVAAVLDGVTG